MNRHKVELHLENIFASQEFDHAFVVILKETGGDRMISLCIGEFEARSIIMQWKGIVAPRPLTHDLFGTVMETLGISLERVMIYRIDKGIYYSYLYFKQGTNILRIDARTSDAIALAIRMHAPIFTYEDIIENERARNAEHTDTTFMGHDAPKNEEPVKSYSQLQRLEDDLQKAIDAEEYELAAKLRDVINKLKEDQ